jgi:hypothetical protein
MGIITNKEKVLEWFKDKGFVKWTLYRSHSNDAKYRVDLQTIDTISIDESTIKLSKAFELFDNVGNYYLYVTDSKTMSGGGLSTLITLSYNGGGGGGVHGVAGVIPSGYVNLDTVNLMIENNNLKRDVEMLKEQAVNGVGRPMSAWENMMENVLRDEGSGKEIAIGLKQMFTGVGVAASKIAGNAFGGAGNGQSQLPQHKKNKNTEGVALQKEDLDGRKFTVLYPKVKASFPDATPQNVFAGIWDFYENADERVRAYIEQSIKPYVDRQQNIESPQPKTDDAENN